MAGFHARPYASLVKGRGTVKDGGGIQFVGDAVIFLSGEMSAKRTKGSWQSRNLSVPTVLIWFYRLPRSPTLTAPCFFTSFCSLNPSQKALLASHMPARTAFPQSRRHTKGSINNILHQNRIKTPPREKITKRCALYSFVRIVFNHQKPYLSFSCSITAPVAALIL